MDIRVEVTDDKVIIGLPKTIDHLIIHWSEALRLSQTLEAAAREIIELRIVDSSVKDIRFNTHKREYVCIIFKEPINRLEMIPEQMIRFSQAIGNYALKLRLECSGAEIMTMRI